MTRLYSRCIFSFLRNCRTVFQKGYTIGYSSPQCMRVPGASHAHQHSEWSVCCRYSSTWMVYLIVVLIFLFIITYDVEHFSFILLCLYRDIFHISKFIHLKGTVEWFLVYSQGCATITTVYL